MRKAFAKSQSSRTKWAWTAVAALAAALLVRPTRPAAAAGGPEAGGAGDAKSAVIASLSVRSLDALHKEADEAHLDLPPFLTAQGIEGVFGFIGAGGMDAARPIGLVFFGSPQMDSQNAVAFVLPVKPGAGTLKTLNDMGGQPVQGHTDTVEANQMAFRRTRDYLIFGKQTEGVTALQDTLLADAVKAPGALADLNVDFKAVRRVVPEQFEQWVNEQVHKSDAKDNPSNDPGYKVGQDLIVNLITKKLDRLNLSLARAGAGLRLATTVEPVKLPQPGNFDRAALPSDTLLRADFDFRIADLYAGEIRSFMKKALEANRDTPANLKDEVAAVAGDAADLWLGGDATSMAVGVAEAKPVFYQVSRYTKDVDFTARLKKVIDGIRDLSAREGKGGEPRPQFTTQTYRAADGTSVTRLAVSRGGTAVGYLDAAQKGRTVYLTMSEIESHPIDRLLSARAETGKMTGVASGSFDLERIVQIGLDVDKDWAKWPDEQRKQLKDAVAGQKLEWSATGGQQSVTFEVTVPAKLVANLSKLAQGGEK